MALGGQTRTREHCRREAGRHSGEIVVTALRCDPKVENLFVNVIFGIEDIRRQGCEVNFGKTLDTCSSSELTEIELGRLMHPEDRAQDVVRIHRMYVFWGEGRGKERELWS